MASLRLQQQQMQLQRKVQPAPVSLKRPRDPMEDVKDYPPAKRMAPAMTEVMDTKLEDLVAPPVEDVQLTGLGHFDGLEESLLQDFAPELMGQLVGTFPAVESSLSSICLSGIKYLQNQPSIKDTLLEQLLMETMASLPFHLKDEFPLTADTLVDLLVKRFTHSVAPVLQQAVFEHVQTQWVMFFIKHQVQFAYFHVRCFYCQRLFLDKHPSKGAKHFLVSPCQCNVPLCDMCTLRYYTSPRVARAQILQQWHQQETIAPLNTPRELREYLKGYLPYLRLSKGQTLTLGPSLCPICTAVPTDVMKRAAPAYKTITPDVSHLACILGPPCGLCRADHAQYVGDPIPVPRIMPTSPPNAVVQNDALCMVCQKGFKAMSLKSTITQLNISTPFVFSACVTMDHMELLKVHLACIPAWFARHGHVCPHGHDCDFLVPGQFHRK